jgi:hypothetical protein
VREILVQSERVNVPIACALHLLKRARTFTHVKLGLNDGLVARQEVPHPGQGFRSVPFDIDLHKESRTGPIENVVERTHFNRF